MQTRSERGLVWRTFEERGTDTLLTIRAEFESAEDLAVSIKGGFGRGWNQSLDKLGRHLAAT